VLHDEPVGTSNGVIDGRRLFACPNKHGGFYAVHEIRVDKHADEKASGGVPKASGGIPQSTASPSGAVGDEAGPSVPCAATSVAAGRGLHTAVVAQLSQITITCNDAYGRRTSGGDSLSVIVRGVSPPTQLRVKLHDHGKGVYVAEYRAELSGQLLIAVCIRGEAVPGSPFSVEALSLHAEASQCKLRGNALVAAVARKPMAFEIDFVDALGNPAAAEELDVRLERAEPLPPEAAPVGIDGDEGGQDAEALAEEKAAFAPGPRFSIAQPCAAAASLDVGHIVAVRCAGCSDGGAQPSVANRSCAEILRSSWPAGPATEANVGGPRDCIARGVAAVHRSLREGPRPG